MCCLHRQKGSHSNELCGSLRAATRMRSGWSLGSKRKFGREVLPIIGFGIVQILKSTGDTFTIIPWHTGSWIGRWNIATARRTQGSSWTACPQRLKPQLRKARIGTSGTRALSVLTAATPLPEAGPAFPSYLKSWRVNFMRIAVIQRKPTGLNLHHDPVAGEENVVRCGQVETVDQRFVGRQRFRSLQALAIAAAKDVSGNH